MIQESYIQTVKNLKEEILKSRYTIAKVANRELLFLYYKVGNVISEKVKNENWGNKTIKKLSTDLQNELNGLRGFSATNLKRMRQFYESWSPFTILTKSKNEISPSVTDQLQDTKKQQNIISPSMSDQLGFRISQTVSSQLERYFANVSFSAHYEIISKTRNIEERVFYITITAQEFWSVRTLKQHLKNKLFEKQATLPNNFKQTIVSNKQKEKALKNFSDHYLLDFIRISDDDEDDEKLLENEIVKNIKKFIISLGSDFAFIGNQFRIIVSEKEYFIDLLFFNRKIQSLVAFDLKTGEFKPEHLGKMNFYLSALDEYVKQEHENTSIGIILCREKENKIVEFAFRDFNKAMGVATYSTSRKLPEKYKNILPDAETLKKIMD
jgi:predicted nuclease of restriction endonuclease-like (RecB) superfamily